MMTDRRADVNGLPQGALGAEATFWALFIIAGQLWALGRRLAA
jgi:hypothetical protein